MLPHPCGYPRSSAVATYAAALRGSPRSARREREGNVGPHVSAPKARRRRQAVLVEPHKMSVDVISHVSFEHVGRYMAPHSRSDGV